MSFYQGQVAALQKKDEFFLDEKGRTEACGKKIGQDL